jgi:hypothetical protein
LGHGLTSQRPRWHWQFANVKTTGYGAAIAELEQGHNVAVKKGEVNEGNGGIETPRDRKVSEIRTGGDQQPQRQTDGVQDDVVHLEEARV